MSVSAKTFVGAVALCALGALLSPSAHAAEKAAVPTVNPAQIAAKHRTTVTEVLQRQARLAPIIKELAPNANQPLVKPRLKATRIAKAKVDECFKAIGEDGPAPDAAGNCPEGTRPKRNQAYVFGAVRSGDYMYYGTLSNPICSAAVAYGYTPPEIANDDFVCEGKRGWANRHLGWQVVTDTRRPQILRTNADTNQTEDISPTDEQSPYFKSIVGIRGQAAHDDVVLIGGPTMNTLGGYTGVELLAYEGSTGKFLGRQLMPQYVNIRRGNVIDGHLYFGVRLAGTGAGSGGSIVKWTGSKADPFKFEIVAQGLPSEPAYLTEHKGHIVTAGWTATGPGGKAVGAMPEMYMGPTLPEGGLTNATADASNWKGVFKTSDYDPDPVVARASQFGDLTSYNGKLVFSTYIYGGFPTLNAFAFYGKPANEIGRLNTYINAERALAVFEMDNVGEADQKVRLLYGEAKLPVFNTTTKRWEPKANVLKQAPKYGVSGFGNRLNVYSWMWEQYKGSLYMSTNDASSLVKGGGRAVAGQVLELSDETLDLLQPVFDTTWTLQGGADVWRFDSLDRPAVPETLDGFGNKNAHGVRGWAAFPDKNKLMAGMATWATLNNTPKHSGGWEVNQLAG